MIKRIKTAVSGDVFFMALFLFGFGKLQESFQYFIHHACIQRVVNELPLFYDNNQSRLFQQIGVMQNACFGNMEPVCYFSCVQIFFF